MSKKELSCLSCVTPITLDNQIKIMGIDTKKYSPKRTTTIAGELERRSFTKHTLHDRPDRYAPDTNERRQRNLSENIRLSKRVQRHLYIPKLRAGQRQQGNQSLQLRAANTITVSKEHSRDEQQFFDPIKQLIAKHEKLNKLCEIYSFSANNSKHNSGVHKHYLAGKSKSNTRISLGKYFSPHERFLDVPAARIIMNKPALSTPISGSQTNFEDDNGKFTKLHSLAPQLSGDTTGSLRSKLFNETGLPQKLQVSSPEVRKMQGTSMSPSLVPIASNNQEHLPNGITVQWVKQEYKPHLQAFQGTLQDLKLGMKRYKEGIYVGEQDANTMAKKGLGIIFYTNGKLFEGHFAEDKKQGAGFEKYPDGSFYMGNFHEGKREGRGKFLWNNGEAYDGEWKGGRKNGSGIWKGPEGISYFGEWRADVIEGFGVLVDKDERYQGEFHNFTKEGRGTYRFANGETYTGSFKRNMPNGMGEYYWFNGDYYKGEFSNGKRHGKGTLKSSQGGYYHGDFRNDKKSGYGEENYGQNVYYIGNFENDLRHGWGVLYCDNNIRLYEGYWLNNEALEKEDEGIETIVEEEYANEATERHWKSSKRVTYQSKYSTRSKVMLKREEKSKLAFKIFKDKSLSKEKSQPKKFHRDCQCERHRQQD